MSHTALIKIAPVFSKARFDDPTWRSDRTMYESGSLRFLPSQDSVPLVVNHDEARVIGTVHELFKVDWTDGPWICARTTVDAPPEWLKRHTPASFSSKILHRREVRIRDTTADVVVTALVTEVSALAPSVEPAEPLAEVLSFRPTETKPAATRSAVTRAAAPAQRTRIGPRDEEDEFRRRLAWLGDGVRMETVLENLQRELQEFRRRG